MERAPPNKSSLQATPGLRRFQSVGIQCVGRVSLALPVHLNSGSSRGSSRAQPALRTCIPTCIPGMQPFTRTALVAASSFRSSGSSSWEAAGRLLLLVIPRARSGFLERVLPEAATEPSDPNRARNIRAAWRRNLHGQWYTMLTRDWDGIRRSRWRGCLAAGFGGRCRPLRTPFATTTMSVINALLVGALMTGCSSTTDPTRGEQHEVYVIGRITAPDGSAVQGADFTVSAVKLRPEDQTCADSVAAEVRTKTDSSGDYRAHLVLRSPGQSRTYCFKLYVQPPPESGISAFGGTSIFTLQGSGPDTIRIDIKIFDKIPAGAQVVEPGRTVVLPRTAAQDLTLHIK